MDGQRVQLIWAHPREDSLAAQVASDVRRELEQHEVSTDEIDLYRSSFDPLIWEADEPDWDDLDKQYSAEVMKYIERTREASTVIFVFPVWWYSFPAILKGYIDRVWNHGYFYGDGRRIGVDSVLWIGLAGDTREAFRKRNYDSMMEHYVNVGIASYCGARRSHLELLYNTLGEDVGDPEAHALALRALAIDAVRRVLAEAPPAG